MKNKNFRITKRKFLLILTLLLILHVNQGLCGSNPPSNLPSPQMFDTPCFPFKIAIFPGIYFSNKEDEISLCSNLKNLSGKDVLDVGTGSGIMALTAIYKGAKHVVATDINPWAIVNVHFNAQLHGWDKLVEPRLVSEDKPQAYSVIADNERFDLIISNPPYFDADVTNVYDRIANDPNHILIVSLLEGLKDHLKPKGKLIMTFWTKSGMRFLRQIVKKYNLKIHEIERTEIRDKEFLKAVVNFVKSKNVREDVNDRLKVVVLEISL